MKGKKILLIKSITLLLMTSTLLQATNGDTLIGVGAKARGMGGVGIAIGHGAESALSNPALINSANSSEISFGGTIFMPDISTSMGQAPYYDSDATINVIPSVSVTNKINENWSIGVGMWGTAGMGVDFRKSHTSQTDSGNMHMVTNLQLMQFGVPIAYKNSGLSLAVAPILQYGALDISYNDFSGSSVGSGISQDLSFGYSLGAAYDMSQLGVDGLMIGAVYKSKIKMDYSDQLSNATQPFVNIGIFPAAMGDNLTQPAEVGLGLSYSTGAHVVAFDYRNIQWSKAEGYQDFGWEDQDVYAVGYQYSRDNWALRVGYNHASQPIKESPSGPSVIAPGSYAQAGGNALNLFNLLGFPATAEDHYTVGGTYAISQTLALDLAYVYAPKTTTTMSTIVGLNPSTGEIYTGPSTVEHTESSFTFQLTYQF